MTSPYPYVPVAGLRVPAPLVPRIIAAFRGTYPDVTLDLEDEAAVRAVLKMFVTSVLTNWEAQQAAASATENIAALKAEAESASRHAREAATTDAESITEAAPPAPEDPVVTL